MIKTCNVWLLLFCHWDDRNMRKEINPEVNLAPDVQYDKSGKIISRQVAENEKEKDKDKSK